MFRDVPFGNEMKNENEKFQTISIREAPEEVSVSLRSMTSTSSTVPSMEDLRSKKEVYGTITNQYESP